MSDPNEVHPLRDGGITWVFYFRRSLGARSLSMSSHTSRYTTRLAGLSPRSPRAETRSGSSAGSATGAGGRPPFYDQDRRGSDRLPPIRVTLRGAYGGHLAPPLNDINPNRRGRPPPRSRPKGINAEQRMWERGHKLARATVLSLLRSVDAMVRTKATRGGPTLGHPGGVAASRNGTPS